MNTKEKIIQSARNLFETYGYKKVSMKEIATGAHITKKTLYSYFNNKDDLFEYFMNEEINSMKEIITKFDRKKIPPHQMFHEILCELIKYKRESKFINIITREIEYIKFSKLKKFDNKINDNIKKFIEERLDLLIEKKEIKDVNVKIVSMIIYNLYKVTLFSDQVKEFDEKEISDTLTLILKEGLISGVK